MSFEIAKLMDVVSDSSAGSLDDSVFIMGNVETQITTKGTLTSPAAELRKSLPSKGRLFANGA